VLKGPMPAVVYSQANEPANNDLIERCTWWGAGAWRKLWKSLFKWPEIQCHLPARPHYGYSDDFLNIHCHHAPLSRASAGIMLSQEIANCGTCCKTPMPQALAHVRACCTWRHHRVVKQVTRPFLTLCLPSCGPC
jgi:hypothetical protein